MRISPGPAFAAIRDARSTVEPNKSPIPAHEVVVVCPTHRAGVALGSDGVFAPAIAYEQEPRVSGSRQSRAPRESTRRSSGRPP